MTGDGTGRTLSQRLHPYLQPQVFQKPQKCPKLPGKVSGKSNSEVAKVFHSRLEGGTVNKATVFPWRRSENRRKLTSGLLHCLWLMVQPSFSSSAGVSHIHRSGSPPPPPPPAYRLSIPPLQEKHTALLEALKEHLRLMRAEVKINLSLELCRRFPSITRAAALPVNSQ